jgi:hypothetical protein
MCWISDLFFFSSDCSFYSYDGVFLSMLPPLHPHHCQSCCYRSEGYFLLVDSASCVCFFVFILLVLVLVLLGRDIDIGDTRSRSEAYDMGDPDMEIRERIFYLALHGPLVVFPLNVFFCPFLKKKCAYRCCVFIIFAQKLHNLLCNVLLMSALNCFDILLLAVAYYQYHSRTKDTNTPTAKLSC